MEINWAERQLMRYQLEAQRITKRLRKGPVSNFFINRTFDLFTTYLDARQQMPVDQSLDLDMMQLVLILYDHAQPRGESNRIVFLWPEALKIAEQLPNPTISSELIIQFSIVKNEQGDVKAAQNLYERLYNSNNFAQLSDYRKSELLLQLGVCYVRQGSYAQAREVLERCLAISTEHAFLPLKAYALNQLGNLAMFKTNFDKAQEYYESTLKTLESVSEEKDLECVAYNSLGRLLMVQRKFHQAIPILEKSHTLWQRREETGGLTKNSVYLSMAYLGCNRLDEAESLLNQALKIHKEDANQRGLALCHYAFGQLEKQRGNRNAAITQWQQALEIYKTVPTPFYELQVMTLLLPELLLTLRLRNLMTTLVRLIRNLSQQDLSLFEMIRFIGKGLRIFTSQIFGFPRSVS